ncbi:MAG: virginiamycin B lyase family protein, partial [Mycobacterium sp.]
MRRLVASLVATTLLLTMPAIGDQVALGAAADTTTTVVSDHNPSVHGEGVTVTATVTYQTVTNYTGTAGNMINPHGIAAGSDGALWFTNAGNNSIGRISTDGLTVTNYTDASISNPYWIAAGSDGALWFTNAGNNSIGRISTAGTVTNYTDASISSPYGIAAGPDGALWFTNWANNSIGRIGTAGTVTNYTGTGISGPYGIAAGSDGALWFTNRDNNSIGRISTAGTVTNYTGTGISGPYGIAAGSDGALWFTNYGNSIGRISTAGSVTNYTGTGISNPHGIAAGPDGALWFTNYTNNSIGRIRAGGIPTGTVEFKDGGTTITGCDAVGLVAGSADCGPISDLSTATHTITAVYSGDTDFATSTSDPRDQVVNKAATTIDITGVDLGTATVLGQTYTVSW